MGDNKKKKIVDDATKIDASFLQPIFGGDSKADPSSPEFNGHLHDGRTDTWGHVSKIDLAAHTSGRLVLQDAYAVAKSVSAYPSVIATPNDIIGGVLTNIPNTSIISDVTFNSFTGPITGQVSIESSNIYNKSSIANQVYPLTAPNILTSAIWYYSLPFDMDVTKPAYFSFGWTADILTSDGYGNTIFDPTKLSNGQLQAQTTIFRVTWQWYSAGYAVFPPAVIYDGYTPVNLPGTNINQNTLTRGRISNLVVNELPFRFLINDSSTNNPNYINLTGLQQATNTVMLGVQVDVLSSGFVNPTLATQSGHINFLQGNFIYLSKTLGNANTAFRTL